MVFVAAHKSKSYNNKIVRVVPVAVNNMDSSVRAVIQVSSDLVFQLIAVVGRERLQQHRQQRLVAMLAGTSAVAESDTWLNCLRPVLSCMHTGT